MGIIRTGESAYDKEMAKWNAPKRMGGFRPDGYEAFPKMVYRAIKLPSGKVVCCDLDPVTQEPRAECSRTVHSEGELNRALNEGWIVGGPKVALDAFEQQEQALGNAAAEALAAAKSEKAKREIDEMNALTMDHIPDVTPGKKKRLKEQAAEGLT